jgi:hypothetical protein
MPKNENDLVNMFSAESLETIQLHVLWAAVKAIIATHPEPEKVRKVFDQLIGQSTANLIVQGEPVEALIVVRDLTTSLFEE